ncbi:TetR/AcrR family transcriptional regulator [Demequina iriomotensis]|uniref:TetR/AcrR family transcriptional regulator n=1 Tax=Demequina iriomotensis TaxID=1536641 RepID=UPI0007838C95|nr:TetR/AcrR family transcriptional regulator [Demequina iriomotensis]
MNPRTPRADSARNHEALLDAASRALRLDVDASLDAIATEAGLSRRAVYGHFAGRDELVAAVISRGAERIANALETPRDPDPLVALARLGVSLWDAIADVRTIARMALSSPHAATVAQALSPVRARVRESLAAATAEGTVRTDVDVETLAMLVERAALDVLDVADSAGADDARLLVMTHPLCAAGVGAERATRIAAEVSA